MENKQIQNFLRYLLEKGVSASSLKYYKSDISSFLSWAGNRKVDTKLVREYINSERLVTPTATLNRRLSTLRSYSNFVGHDFMSGIENVTTARKIARSWQESLLNRFEARPKLKNLFSKVLFNRPNWYRKYHSYALANYVHIAILILFSSLSGYAVYDQVFYSTDRSLAFPTALERPNRFLSFQGRLTDDLGNPQTVATNMAFNLYSVSSGGSTLWNSGTCSITPDQDGIFSTLLGSSCGAEIASSVFSENADIWLGVTVAGDAEATPRIQIATVAYALNSETLQGFPAGTGTSTIPYINSSGTMVLANASPKIQSTSGTFAVEGQALTITTPNTSNGIITINPDGTGTLDLTFEGASAGGSANGFVNATNANITSGSLYAGTVASNATGYNFINFLSGASPTSKFSVQDDGDILTTGDITVGGGNINTGNIALVIGDGTTDSVTISTDGTGNGEVVLPNDSIGPNELLTTGQTDEYCLTYEASGTTMEWQLCSGGSGPWTDGSGITYLTDTAEDFAIGGTTLAASMFGIDESAGNFYFGYDNSANPTLNFEATDGDAGEFGFNTNDSFYLTNALFGIGTTSPLSRLSVINNPGAGNYTGKAAFLVDQYESQDILTASASGVTKLTLQNDGTLKLANATSTISNDSGDITIDSFANIVLTTDGTGNSEVVLPNDSIGPNELQSTGQTDEYCLTYETTGAGLEWQTCGGGSLFTDSGAVTYLTSVTDDFAIGGTTLAASMFGIDESAGNFYFGYDNSANPTLNFEATDGDAGEFGFNTNDSFFFSNANVGIGTTGPDARLDTLSTTGEQLRLSYTDGSVYSGFTVDSNGYLIIDPTGSRTAIDGVLQVGGTSPLTYSRFGTGTTAHSGNIDSASDLLISGDLEVDGTLFLDGGTIANSSGTSFISFSGNNLYLNSTNDITILEDPTIQLSAANPAISATATNSTLSLAANGVGTLTLQNGATGNIQFFSGSNTLSSSGDLTLAGDIAINGGDITSSASTFNFLDNTTTKTIEFGGVTSSAADTIRIATNATAADVIEIGNSHASTTLQLTGGTSWSIATNGNITTAGDLAINGDDITSDSNLDISATGYVRIGDSGTPNLANGDDDLYVEGDIELDGNLYIGTGALYDDNVTAGIQLGATNETALVGFGASSIVGALNELKSSNKNTGRNDYLSWANHYQSQAEGTINTNNEKSNGLFFDTFEDATKFDGTNSTSSGTLKIGDDSYRVGIMGGQTMNTATNDNDGQAYLGSNTVNEIYYYDRAKDSNPEVLVELGIDPNWYNGVTLSVATNSATYSQNGTLADKNPNLTTSYNGSLIKATGTDTTPRTIFITIKSPTTFDWTNYQGDSATAVTITPGTAQTLGSTGVSATFTATNYNVGDVFKISSWYIEAEGTNRGAKQQFPERANIVATASSVDIIDADTQKLWMGFDQNASGYMIGVDTSNDPSAVNGLNGHIYVSENGASATGLYTLDFVSDAGFRQNATDYRKADGAISLRNSAVTYNVINTSQTLVTVTANDVAAAVIPNQPTQEITVSSWGYIVGDATTIIEESVTLPYKFNTTPQIIVSSGGYGLTTAPTSPYDCSNRADTPVGQDALPNLQTTSSFQASIVRSTGTFSASAYYCYFWTATGTVSPKQFVAVATGATSADGGTTIINETDGTKADISIGSQDGLTLRSNKLAIANNSLYISSGSYSPTFMSTYYNIHGLTSESTYAQYRNGYYYVNSQAGSWSSSGPVIMGATAVDEIKSLYATPNSSTNDPTSNTIYVGTTTGVTVINELNGQSYSQSSASTSDSRIESTGSVKYYTKDYISEDMIGDIRAMWPFNGSGTIADNANGTDVSIKANILDADNANGTGFTYSSGVRGTGVTLDNTDDFFCSDADNNNACDSDTDHNMSTTSFSTSIWFKHNTTAANDSLINRMYTTTPSAGDGFTIFMDTNGKMNFAIDDDTTWTNFTSYDDLITSGASYNDDQWHHLTAVKDGVSAIYLYIDGQLVGNDASLTATASISDSASILGVGADCSVGAACATGSNFWNGSIDELTITATALTSAQIKNMYQIGYRALQSHSTGLSSGTADGNQALAGASNIIGVVEPDYNNQYVYVGTNHTTDGALTKIQLNSDTAIKNWDVGDNDPDGGTQIIDDDITSLAVGYQLEAVGSAASGVKSMAPDDNSNALTGSLFSKTQTLNSATKFAYLWTSVYTDSSDANSAINVYACNNYATKALCDSNSAWVLGTTIQTDTTQSIPEREYNFSFPNAGSYLTFKIDFKRNDNKGNTYIERYGATWASSVGGADLAERYKSSEPVYPGEILSIASSPVDGEAMVELSKTGYDKKVIGIVTTNPGIVMDDNLVDLNFNAASRNSPDRPAVALSGRVPIKVSTANGKIEVGDAITTSEIAGVGIKATKAGSIVAKALENFECEPVVNEDGTETTPEICEGKVLAFVNVSWFDPDAYLTTAGDLRIKGFEEIAEDGTTIKTVYKIVRVAISGVEEIIDKIGVFKSVSTQDINTNIISPIADSDLIIDLDPNNSTDSAKLAIKGVNDEEVASIDAIGNAEFDGIVTSNELIVNNDATISGTLYADDIRSTKLTEIEDLLREVEENQSLLASVSSWESQTATDSGNIIAESIETENLFVTGVIALNSVSITDSISFGNDFVFQSLDNSINTLTAPLSLQSLAMAPLEIMAGRIKIDTDGNTQFLGNVEIAGNLNVNGDTTIKKAIFENLVVATSIDTATESAEIIEGEINTNSVAGKAVLLANEEVIRINNPKVNDNSLIYVTPISSTQNKVLYVKSKGDGYLEIGFSETLDSDVEFNWWIIELQTDESEEILN